MLSNEEIRAEIRTKMQAMVEELNRRLKQGEKLDEIRIDLAKRARAMADKYGFGYFGPDLPDEHNL
jgi:hypothetical protein